MQNATRRLGLVIAVLGLVVGAAGQARAGILAQYAFTGGSFAPLVGTNMFASAVNATGSLATIEAGVADPDTLFLRQGVLSTTPAEAVANQQFFQFTATPNGGYEFNLSSLTLDAGMGGANNSPSGYVLRSSIDGFSTDLSTGVYSTVQPSLVTFSTDLSSAAFQNLSGAVTFRVYNFQSNVGGVGTFFDNVTLNGVTVRAPIPTPEPSTIALACSAVPMGLGLAWRRRHKTVTA